MIASVSKTELQGTVPGTDAASRIALRKFPYPYRAGLAICSDIDETRDANEFLEIQRFLNTRQHTSMGDGVGLEIGNSFYFYDDQEHLSYFTGDEQARRVILDFVHAGYVDCLHSFGDAAVSWDQVARSLDVLAKMNLQLPVWVNHYGAPTDLSKKFEYMFRECRGDDPSSELYHANHLSDYGVRFAWLGATTRVIGQSPERHMSYLSTVFDPDHPVPSAMSVLKEIRKHTLGQRGDERFTLHRSNDLTRMTELGDGRKIHEFIRYCDHPKDVPRGATSRGLAYVISQRVLERLEEVQGFMIVYTHLGKNKDCAQAIALETQVALRGLEREYRSGNIFVTTTSRLLTYYNTTRYLNWSVRDVNAHSQIEIEYVDDPVLGRHVPSAAELQGITFLVPRGHPVNVYLQGVELKGLERHPAEEARAMDSLLFPFKPLVFPY